MLHSRTVLIFTLIAVVVICLGVLAALDGGAYTFALLILFPFLVLALYLGLFPLLVTLLPRAMWAWENERTMTDAPPESKVFQSEVSGMNAGRTRKDKKAA